MTRSFRSGLLLAASALALISHGGAARADAAGDKVLTAMDGALNRAKTQYFEYDVINQEPGKAERKLGLQVRLKGEKRFTEFTAPADMKGTKILIMSPTQMYVFLPAFGKVRRIASSVSDQGFLGMTFSQDDLASQAYNTTYQASIASEDATAFHLVVTPKAGQTTPYAKIEIAVGKDKMLPTELKYFNAAGVNVKTETRTGYTCEGNVCVPSELKMVDNTKGGASTRMVRTKWKVNEEMSDDLFSKRALGE
ncbi:MAG: outer membrane lipoprotein-sorting protein [Byssovorax sp.]